MAIKVKQLFPNSPGTPADKIVYIETSWTATTNYRSIWATCLWLRTIRWRVAKSRDGYS